MLRIAEEDFQALKALLEQEKFQEAYEQYEPVIRDMLSVFSEAEWINFCRQYGKIEEYPLRFHLAAWKGDCLELGGYEEDITERLMDYFQQKLPKEVYCQIERHAVYLDIDEPSQELEPQLKPYQEQLERLGYGIKAYFDDTYCGGIYFVFLENMHL